MRPERLAEMDEVDNCKARGDWITEIAILELVAEVKRLQDLIKKFQDRRVEI